MNSTTTTKRPHPTHEIPTDTDYAENIKGFLLSLAAYVIILPGLYYLNLSLSPDYLWVKWVALFWGMGVVLHALVIKIFFGKFDLNWNKSQAEKGLSGQD